VAYKAVCVPVLHVLQRRAGLTRRKASWASAVTKTDAGDDTPRNCSFVKGKRERGRRKKKPATTHTRLHTQISAWTHAPWNTVSLANKRTLYRLGIPSPYRTLFSSRFFLPFSHTLVNPQLSSSVNTRFYIDGFPFPHAHAFLLTVFPSVRTHAGYMRLSSLSHTRLEATPLRVRTSSL